MGWGDCEDYSLIFKATLNTAKSDMAGLEAVTFAPGGTANFRIYPKESAQLSTDESYWYVPNAKTASLGFLDKSHFYVICYRSGATIGHCTVAISPNELLSSSDMPLLSGAQVFEPQNGLYLGSVGSEFPICSSEDCTGKLYNVQLVITDGDLYKFEGGKWVGYADYLQKVEQAKIGLKR